MRRLAVVLAVLALPVTSAARQLVASHAPTSPAPTVVARVNAAVITSDRLEAATNRLIPASSFHRNVNPEKRAALRQQALESLIDEELLYQEARRQQLLATPAEVERGLRAVKRRYKSSRAFEQARKQAGVTLENLRAELRRQVLLTKVVERAITSKCSVTEEAGAAFYKENPARFRMPEQLHVWTITVRVDPSGSKDDWANGRRTAEDVARQLHNGATFEELARKYSSDPSRERGGDMGFVHRGQMTDEFEAILKDMRPGETSPVVQSIYGYHIVRLTEIRPPVQKSYPEIRVQLRKDLAAKNCAAMKDDWIRRLRSAATIEIPATRADAAKPPGAGR